MSIAARYAGVCPECELPWKEGDLIRTTDDDGRVWVHTVCPYEVERSIHPVCPTCFLEHPEGACDR